MGKKDTSGHFTENLYNKVVKHMAKWSDSLREMRIKATLKYNSHISDWRKL